VVLPTPARERSIGEAVVVVSLGAPGAHEDVGAAKPRLATAAALARPRPRLRPRRREAAEAREGTADDVVCSAAAGPVDAAAAAHAAAPAPLLLVTRRVDRSAPKRAVVPRADMGCCTLWRGWAEREREE
jgi:hypothetical protein